MTSCVASSYRSNDSERISYSTRLTVDSPRLSSDLWDMSSSIFSTTTGLGSAGTASQTTLKSTVCPSYIDHSSVYDCFSTDNRLNCPDPQYGVETPYSYPRTTHTNVSMDSSAAEIVFSPEEDMGVIPLPSRPIQPLSCYGPLENTIQASFHREQQCLSHPMQRSSAGSLDRYYQPECDIRYVSAQPDERRYQRQPYFANRNPFAWENPSVSCDFFNCLPTLSPEPLNYYPTQDFCPQPAPSYDRYVHYDTCAAVTPSYVAAPTVPLDENTCSPHQVHAYSGYRSGATGEKKPKAKYAIDIDKVRKSIEKRHTVMLKNIPNSFTQNDLLRILDFCVPNCYDFVYIPIDFQTKCNLGFGYVSLINSESLIKLYEFMNMKRWPNTSSNKVCEVTFARIQGDRDMRRICKDWSVMQLPEQYHPIFYQKEVVVINGVEHVILKKVK